MTALPDSTEASGALPPEVDLVLGVLVTPDGVIERRQLEPSWLGIRDVLGVTWITGQELPFGVKWWADEDAHPHTHPVNDLASRAAAAAGRQETDPLRGPVLFLGVRGARTVGLPGEIAGWIEDHFGPGAGLREYRVTFGQRYRREEHPRFPAAHPDGWVTVLAGDAAAARRAVVDRLGMWWCDLYGPDASTTFDVGQYPRGELARFTAIPDNPSSTRGEGGGGR